VLWRSFFDLGAAFSALFLLLAGAVFVLGKLLTNPALSARGRKGGIVLSLFLLAVSLGMFRYDLSDFGRGASDIDALIGREAAIRGVVAGEPDVRENNIRLILKAQGIIVAGEERPAAGKILVVADLFPEFNYGDEVIATGAVKRPAVFEGENEKIFNYPAYLAKDGIYHEMFRPKISFISSGNGNPLTRSLLKVKRAFVGVLNRLIPEPESSLLAGLLLGAKQSLGKALLDDFRTVGLIHVVVLSGYNITVVADFIGRVFRFLPVTAARLASAAGIILFVMMTGASATVVRASMMALLVILARTYGRPYQITRALLLTGFLMILHNPKILAFDPSFQLSFLATVALIYLSPLMEKRFTFIPEKWNLRQIAAATAATQIFVLPLLLYKTGAVSLVFLPVNLLVLLFVPVTMLFGFLAALAALFFTALAVPFAFVASTLLSYEIWIVETFAKLPFASVSIVSFPLWAMLLVYAFYLWFVVSLRRKEKPSVSPD